MLRALLVIAALAFAFPAAAAKDSKFLKEAIAGNLAEVQLGELAQQKAQSADVKSFGQTLAADHGKALDVARQAANELKVAAPSGPNAKQQSLYKKLSRLSGAAFDKTFVKHIISDHKHDIKAYAKEASKKGPAADYATAQLPTLRHHLQTAQTLKSTAVRE